MEWNWGPIANWPAVCAEEWTTVKERDSGFVATWLVDGGKKVASSCQMLGYLGCVMEGALPAEIKVLRDLYLQGHQLTCTFNAAVIRLERTLVAAQSEIQGHTAHKCGCGRAICVTYAV